MDTHIHSLNIETHVMITHIHFLNNHEMNTQIHFSDINNKEREIWFQSVKPQSRTDFSQFGRFAWLGSSALLGSTLIHLAPSFRWQVCCAWSPVRWLSVSTTIFTTRQLLSARFGNFAPLWVGNFPPPISFAPLDPCPVLGNFFKQFHICWKEYGTCSAPHSRFPLSVCLHCVLLPTRTTSASFIWSVVLACTVPRVQHASCASWLSLFSAA